MAWTRLLPPWTRGWLNSTERNHLARASAAVGAPEMAGFELSTATGAGTSFYAGARLRSPARLTAPARRSSYATTASRSSPIARAVARWIASSDRRVEGARRAAASRIASSIRIIEMASRTRSPRAICLFEHPARFNARWTSTRESALETRAGRSARNSNSAADSDSGTTSLTRADESR